MSAHPIFGVSHGWAHLKYICIDFLGIIHEFKI